MRIQEPNCCSNTAWSLAFISTIILLGVSPVHSWVSSSRPVIGLSPTLSSVTTCFLSSSTDTTATDNTLGGVADFETWFTASPNTSCRPSIRHAAFGSLRGLTFTEDKAIDKDTLVLTVPRSLVLHAPYSEKDWDVQLAEKLWKECQKGMKSDIYGYCSLLSRGTIMTKESIPPSTAPNALRHWTAEQRQALESSSQGRKLLDSQRSQELQWKNKFSKVGGSAMSWEQFEWAMEVVHSRAFRGNFGSSTLQTVGSAVAPILAAALGWGYMHDNQDISDAVLVGLALVAVTPTLLGVVFPESAEAVLLPLIDSANHLESADSSIEYNPLSKAFGLKIGPSCLVPEKGGETQLYVSYGQKSDSELLLNYGFLPSVQCSDGEDEPAVKSQRRRLAEEFIRRNHE